MTAERDAVKTLKAEGWQILDDQDGFIDLVGPMWHRVAGKVHEYAIVAQAKHRNRRGLVQGGLLMTLADRACGMTARFETASQQLATIQMDTQFIDAGKIGDLLITRPRVVRATRSLIFMSTEVHAGERCVAMASGVFKVMRA